MLLGKGLGPPVIDPFVVTEVPPYVGYKVTNGRTPKPLALDTTKKNLVLIVAGQSNATSTFPTLHQPTNNTKTNTFSLYDGAIYDYNGPLIGSGGPTPLGPGNLCAYLPDLLLATFDYVLMVPVAIGSTYAADWATGVTSNRIPVAMKRLISKGITATTPNVTMALLWVQGENDSFKNTSLASYQASFRTILANAKAAGFSGRAFVCEESWNAGVTNTIIQQAQTGLVDNVNIFSGGNLDALGANYRQADSTHFNDSGAVSAASTIYTAMHASGAPF